MSKQYQKQKEKWFNDGYEKGKQDTSSTNYELRFNKLIEKWMKETKSLKEVICINLCNRFDASSNICHNMGCPLSSSIACLISRYTGAPLYIDECTNVNNTITVRYRLVGE